MNDRIWRELDELDDQELVELRDDYMAAAKFLRKQGNVVLAGDTQLAAVRCQVALLARHHQDTLLPGEATERGADSPTP